MVTVHGAEQINGRFGIWMEFVEGSDLRQLSRRRERRFPPDEVFNIAIQAAEGLQAIDGVTVYGTGDAALQTATVSINIRGLAPSEVGLALDRNHDIATRVGLHCAPAAHRTLGTLPDGTVAKPCTCSTDWNTS